MSIEIVKDKTAEGLRDRLFDALDAVIDKKLGKDEIESICYVSEQILKTARHELEVFQESARVDKQKRDDERAIKKEEKEALLMLKNTISATFEMRDEKEA